MDAQQVVDIGPGDDLVPGAPVDAVIVLDTRKLGVLGRRKKRGQFCALARLRQRVHQVDRRLEFLLTLVHNGTAAGKLYGLERWDGSPHGPGPHPTQVLLRQSRPPDFLLLRWCVGERVSSDPLVHNGTAVGKILEDGVILSSPVPHHSVVCRRTIASV